MKILKSATFRSIAATAIVVGASIPFAAASAQALSAEASAAARQACISSAESKGFLVAEVVSIEPKAGVADGANVILSLTKAGQPYKLTCGYTKDAGAVFGDNTAPAATTTAPAATTTAPATATETVKTLPPASLAPLWWLLLPIIGLPLLMWWTRGRGAAAAANARRDYVTGSRTEAVIRNNGSNVNVYSGPGTDYRVTGTLRDGQTVWLSGRHDNNWAELENGGWIPTQTVDTTVTRYAR
jgi:uncharacterized protein YgiM (DUF1202 family)